MRETGVRIYKAVYSKNTLDENRGHSLGLCEQVRCELVHAVGQTLRYGSTVNPLNTETLVPWFKFTPRALGLTH